MPHTTTEATHRAELIALACQVITAETRSLPRVVPDPAQFASVLQRRQASFVTLSGAGNRLRGCCGNLQPHGDLLTDLARNAWQTAFADPRFPPVTADELAALEIEIALLSRLTAIAATSRETLLDQLQPGLDGLLIEAADGRRATFLPKVWASLPEPEIFLDHLLHKAGLADWSAGISAFRYRTERFSGAFRSSVAARNPATTRRR